MKAKHLLISLLLTAIVSPLFSQTIIGRQNVDQYPVTAAGALTYGLTYLPADYDPSKKYPLILFLHGSGEGGDGVSGLNNLINQGLPWWIARGFNPSAVSPVDGKTYEFIVCSPQAPSSWQWSYAYLEIQYMMPDILSRYSIDQSRIYVTGLSAGGSGTWSCVCDDPTFAQKIAAIMPNSDAALNNSTVEGPFLKDITSVYGVPVWCVDGALDGLHAHTILYIDTINTGPPVANPLAVQTLIAGAGHSAAAWDSAYSPTWRANQFGQTAYEWFLRYQRTGPGNTFSGTPLTANAGAGQTITLPASSVSLSGFGSPAPGSTIASYQWIETGGPNTASIGSPNSSSTTVSGLTQGGYTFQLTVIDNTGASATSTVSITVNPLINVNVGAIIPTVNAGLNQTITLPSNSATLGGLVIGNGAPVTYNLWTQVSGPNTATIANPWATTTSVTSLVAGTYTFQLSVNVLGVMSASANVIITVNPAAAVTITVPATGSGGYAPIPGIVQAEDYTTMSGVQTETTKDVGGGLDVGWIDQGDWMDYNVYASYAGTYIVSFRVATPFSGGVLQLQDANGNILADVNVPNTTNFEFWQTVTANVTLPAGNQTLQIVNEGGVEWNINWIDFETNTAAPPSGITIPGIVQAEDYTTMSGVQTETTKDVGGGLDVGWIDQGDWMDYNVYASVAGTYIVSFRVATPFSGGVLQLQDANGNILADVNVPNTSNFEFWQTVTANVTLPAGNQTLQIVNEGGVEWNINWIDFETNTAASPSGITIPGIVQAEDYTTMSGVQTETTKDVGGGLDVGWIDQGDWMDYNVYASYAGTYIVGFRIATPFSGGVLQLQDANGNILADVNVPNTSNFEFWQTVTASVTLPAGNQTLQIVNESGVGWNINWIDFETNASAIAQSTTVTNGQAAAISADLGASLTPALSLFPNPAQDNFILNINNNQMGKMIVQIINPSGQISKTYSLNKGTQSSTATLAVGDLPTGVYSIRIQIGDWSAVRQLVKLK